MSNEYYESIDKMEKANVSREYIVGWASGYFENPLREEQRITEAYEAGYNDGKDKNTSGFKEWVGK